MLNVRCRGLDQAFAVTQERAKTSNVIAWSEAAAEQPMLVKLLQPRGVVHVALSARYVLPCAGIYSKHFEASCFEYLESGSQVHARRPHRDRRNADRLEPIREPMQITGEALERPDGLWISIRWYSNDVKRCADVQ